MRWLLIAGLVLALTPSAAQVSERPDSVRVTVYHDSGENDPAEFRDPDPEVGLAFITEIRTIDVPAGPATIELRGIASTIIPQTAMIEGLPVPLTERNFDYDLLSPGSLLAKSLGETVTLKHTDRKTGKIEERKAVVRTGPHGVVLDFGGSYEVLGCSGLKESLIFSKVPEGLRDSPTLSIRTNAREAGRYTIRLSYLATHVNWAVSYVARLHGDRLDLSGWVTLVNGGETSFKNVPLDIVAGTVQRETEEDKSVEIDHVYRQGRCWPTSIRWHKLIQVYEALQRMAGVSPPPAPPPPPMAAADVGSLETVAVTGFRASRDLGDYKLYSLEGTTDVLARQTKLVHLLDQKDVPFERVYYLTLNRDAHDTSVSVAMRLKNTQQNHLGLALPAGLFTATEISGSGAPVVLNRTGFENSSVDSPIELELGRALDVVIRPELISEKVFVSGSKYIKRSTVEFSISNHKAAPIDFEMRLPVTEDFKLASESVSHIVTPHGQTWVIHQAAGETRRLRITVDMISTVGPYTR